MNMNLDAKESDHNRFSALESRIGYQFSEYSNLERALTHSSSRKDSGDIFHYERLEFLGDRVLGVCISDLLFKKFPDAREGELSRRLNTLVKGNTLAEISDELRLYEFIRTGGDLKHITGKRMRGVRADALEALIASIYLDGGLQAAQQFVVRFWKERLEAADAAKRDSKTELQEWAHANRQNTPRYLVISRSGPDHDPEFVVEVHIDSLSPEKGVGKSKRSAEQNAAGKLLVRQGVWDS